MKNAKMVMLQKKWTSGKVQMKQTSGKAQTKQTSGGKVLMHPMIDWYLQIPQFHNKLKRGAL